MAREPQSSGAPAGEFEHFVARHARELGRLAYLLLGDHDAADDLTGDAFLVAWRQWDTVRSADRPLAYMRRVMVNLATSRIRRLIRERHGMVMFHPDATQLTDGPDGAAVLDVRAALMRLPAGRRACLVLRYAFDVAEQDVAEMLGISVGTVKSQTSKGVEQFRRALGGPFPPAPARRAGATRTDRQTLNDRQTLTDRQNLTEQTDPIEWAVLMERAGRGRR